VPGPGRGCWGPGPPVGASLALPWAQAEFSLTVCFEILGFRRNFGLVFLVSCEVACRPRLVPAWLCMACELGMAFTFLNG